MAFFRALLLMALVLSAFIFALYAVTGQPHYKTWGLRVFKCTVWVLLGFFAVLVVDRFD